MPWCRTCKDWMVSEEPNRHRCPPAWLLWRPEESETIEDAHTIYAAYPDSAAEKWAEEDDRDSAEYGIANGRTARVHLRLASDPNAPVIVLDVTGEYDPTYTAHAVRGEAT